MFPIGDDEIRGAGPAWINYLLIIINTVVFLFEATMDPNSLQDFVTRWGVIPVQILQGTHLINILTAMFLHGGWLHLIGNMLFLWVFGDNVEAVMGHFGYLIFYLAGGVVASLTHVMFNADSTIPSLGASGAIAAVLGAYILMFPQSRVKVFVFVGIGGWITRVSAILFLGIWFVTQLFNGVASLGVQTAQTSGIAVWAHVGGFLFGIIIGLFFRAHARRLTFGQQ